MVYCVHYVCTAHCLCGEIARESHACGVYDMAYLLTARNYGKNALLGAIVHSVITLVAHSFKYCVYAGGRALTTSDI